MIEVRFEGLFEVFDKNGDSTLKTAKVNVELDENELNEFIEYLNEKDTERINSILTPHLPDDLFGNDFWLISVNYNTVSINK